MASLVEGEGGSDQWLKMLVIGFQVAYGADAEIEIERKEAANCGGLFSNVIALRRRR
jgi:hypothetical protein